MDIHYRSIGVIRSPFTTVEGMPIQPAGAEGVQGSVEVFAEYAEGLADLEGFSHVILLYHFHRSEGFRLRVTPFLDTASHGVFATRAPARPNPIGLSVVRLLRRDGAILHVQNLDVLDGTPLLDIKPYVPRFDQHPAERIGWLARSEGGVEQTRSDKRFQ
jgi:tRNA-Thr(GGU) m(6)t(6)A37 methyltransferase TsaA